MSETHPPGSEKVKSVEIPKAEIHEQQKHIETISPQIALDALNKTTPGTPDRADLINLSQVGSNFDFADSDRPGSVVGGQIIEQPKVRVGQSPEAALTETYQKAITNAARAEKATDTQRYGNVQDIVDVAKAAGVSPDALRDQVGKLGLNQSNETKSTTGSKDNKVSEPLNSVRDAIDTYRKSGDAEGVRSAVEQAIALGAKRDEIAATLSWMGIDVKRKPTDSPGTPATNTQAPPNLQQSPTSTPSGEAIMELNQTKQTENSINNALDLNQIVSTPGETQKETREIVSGREHVRYAPRIRVVPDTHGLSPDHYGVTSQDENVVSVGDIIDAPKNLQAYDKDRQRQNFLDAFKRNGQVGGMKTEVEINQFVEQQAQRLQKETDAANNIDIKKNVQVWTELMKSGKGDVVLGNHELMAMSGLAGNDNDLHQWLLDANKGKTTLEAFGINISDLPQATLDANNFLNPSSADASKQIRERVAANPELTAFFDQLYTKGKMYMVANEALVVHAGVPVGPDGRLIPPQRNGKDFPGFENMTGLDAMDAIEEGIRRRDPNILHWVGSASSKEMSPGWVREPFFDIMRDQAASGRALSELRAQAQKRGGDVKAIMIGHTENVGGKMVGSHVLGTDTAVGDVVDLDATSKNGVKIQARHNFGQSNQIGYQLTKQIQ